MCECIIAMVISMALNMFDMIDTVKPVETQTPIVSSEYLAELEFNSQTNNW